MRLPDMFSALTLNIILALFSMVMAIIALSLLAFVLAKETQTERNSNTTVPRYNPREKIKRHESTTVDFRNPSTFPDHFLQLNTLMFQKKTVKKTNNNQITQMPPISLEGMEKMTKQTDDEERLAIRPLPPLPNEISTNAVGRHRRAQLEQAFVVCPRSKNFFSIAPGIIMEEDFSDTASTRSTDAPSSLGENSTADVWVVEKSTIEPLAEKRIVDLECGTEVSLC